MKRQCAICRISLLIVIRFKLIISILQKTQNKQQAQTNNACTFCCKNYKHNTSIQKIITSIQSDNAEIITNIKTDGTSITTSTFYSLITSIL